MKKKFLSGFMAVMVAGFVLAGCGSGGNTETTKGAGTTAAAEESDNFNAEGFPIVKEPITLKVVLGIRNQDSLMPPNDMPLVQELEKKTGIHIEWDVIKAADWSTKINLMFSSGEYPDIFITPNTGMNVEEYGVSQGILLPVDELTEKYMPTYTERIKAEDSDPTLSLVASDGKKYSIGYLVGQNINADQHFFINQEWLDNLGLPMPQTFDELTDTLRAFKTGDPNGNGQPDEIPLCITIDSGNSCVRNMLPMFGVPAGGKWLYIDEDKQIQFAPTQQGFRDCLTWLHMLYQEGVLDPEVLSQDDNTVNVKKTEGNIGFTVEWRLMAMGWDEGITKTHTLYMPTAPEGVEPQIARYLEVAGNGAFVTSSNQHIPESMRWLDNLLETSAMFSMYYGEEGKAWEYDAENGKVNTLITDTSQLRDCLDCNALFFAPTKYISETFNMSPQRIQKTEYCQRYDAAGVIQKYANRYLDMAPLSSEQREELSLIQTDINNAVKESIPQFIAEGVTDKSWDAYIKRFDNMKVDKLVSTYQEGIEQLDID